MYLTKKKNKKKKNRPNMKREAILVQNLYRKKKKNERTLF